MPDVSAAARLELVAPGGIGAVRPGDDLARLAVDALRREGIELRDGDIVVLAQKIVSKSEDRYVALDSVEPTPRAVELAAACMKDPRLIELVLRESRKVLRVAPNVIVVEDRRGLVLANAGIDQSNVEADPSGRGQALLLPEDPDASARRLRERLESLSGVRLGVIVNDSLGRAWRLGTIGTAIGVSGLPGLLDRRGEADLEGRALQSTEVGFADELAAAASALMGQAAEGRPVVLIRGAVVARRDGAARELQRPLTKDLFR
jgi:coenzyme F420-0:L-glutamate ligase/coenzyme F420-1:gamma-L-glutamate ligase